MVSKVREECVDRDGHCRLAPAQHLFGPCRGPSQWSHRAGRKRSQTRGEAPERRHTTADSMMQCQRHHELYERGVLADRPLTDRGADGPLEWTMHRATRWAEPHL